MSFPWIKDLLNCVSKNTFSEVGIFLYFKTRMSIVKHKLILFLVYQRNQNHVYLYLNVPVMKR